MKKKLLIFTLVLSMLGIFGVLGAVEFDLQAFADTTKYNWENYIDRNLYRQDLLTRQGKLQLYEMEAISFEGNLLKSAVFPGWGQFNTKHNTKASIIMSAEVLSVMGAYYFYNRSMRYHEKYMQADQLDDINTYWSKAQEPYIYSLLLSGLAGIVWFYNIFDVVQSANDYNDKLWLDILSRDQDAPVRISPAGIQVRF
ncbi:MAG TPA: hypothetical protein GXX77_02440 [Candidatus Cloacimonetes bacterium]|nr:hypothetical protein [Candidatus Cloacimonadota bacterium]